MKDRLKEHICTLLQEKGGRAVIAIDGMAASGKSTLAARLAEELDGCVIHMDDFFLPPELRTQERLSSPGGNVHYERFEAEVAEALRSGRDFEYGVFDCSRMEITASRRIKAGGLVIVEGAYALRPELRDIYDMKIFMKIDSGLQEQRITARNGSEKAKTFKEKWIPMEMAYFKAFDVEKAADAVIDQSFKECWQKL